MRFRGVNGNFSSLPLSLIHGMQRHNIRFTRSFMSIDGGLSVWPFVAVTLIRIGCVIVLYFCCNFAAISFLIFLFFQCIFVFFDCYFRFILRSSVIFKSKENRNYINLYRDINYVPYCDIISSNFHVFIVVV